MLPSTFEDKLKKEEELKKRLNVKLEIAKFLQVCGPCGGLQLLECQWHAAHHHDCCRLHRNADAVTVVLWHSARATASKRRAPLCISPYAEPRIAEDVGGPLISLALPCQASRRQSSYPRLMSTIRAS